MNVRQTECADFDSSERSIEQHPLSVQPRRAGHLLSTAHGIVGVVYGLTRPDCILQAPQQLPGTTAMESIWPLPGHSLSLMQVLVHRDLVQELDWCREGRKRCRESARSPLAEDWLGPNWPLVSRASSVTFLRPITVAITVVKLACFPALLPSFIRRNIHFACDAWPSLVSPGQLPDESHFASPAAATIVPLEGV